MHTRRGTGKRKFVRLCRELKYSYHDVMNMDKFPEFTKQVYLQTGGVDQFGEPIHQPVQWAAGLEKTGILGMLDLTHFGRG
jgi:hypothetical protein